MYKNEHVSKHQEFQNTLRVDKIYFSTSYYQTCLKNYLAINLIMQNEFYFLKKTNTLIFKMLKDQ